MAADRIAWKPRFLDPRVASTRIRCLNPLSELQSRGYPVELFHPQRVSHYAAVVYSKLYDDATYHEAKGLQRRGVRIVLDLCDNHFYNPNGLETLTKAREQLRRMMALADELVASTAAMSEVMRAELSTPRNVTIIEDAVETEIRGVRTLFWDRWWEKNQLAKLLRQLKDGNQNGRTPLVWFGIHGGSNAEYGMLDLLKLRPLLEKLNRHYPLSLTVISNSRVKYVHAIKPWKIPTYYLAWHPNTFFAALRAHSVAIIPISQNPFTICKGSHRVGLALQLGLAVVANSIPSYRAFTAACFLDDWQRGLNSYLANPELRQCHVKLGREIVAREFILSHIAEKWRRLFDSSMYYRTAQASLNASETK